MKKFLDTLKDAGYSVEVTNHGSFDHAMVTGKGIVGGCCTLHADKYNHYYINGKFAADNEQCFNKWRTCPLIVKLPETDDEINKILEYLAFLATEEGFTYSDTYSYHDDPKLPRDLEPPSLVE